VTPDEQARIALYLAGKYARRGECPGDLVGVAWLALRRCLDSPSFDRARRDGWPYLDKAVRSDIAKWRWAERRTSHYGVLTVRCADLESFDRLSPEDCYFLCDDPPPEFLTPADFTAIPPALDALAPQAREAVRLRAGIGCEPHQQREIAAKLGVSRARVNEILRDAYRALRKVYGVRTPTPGRSQVRPGGLK
jgi:DNA-directed RNA polymerase specialized sigma24 family protein